MKTRKWELDESVYTDCSNYCEVTLLSIASKAQRLKAITKPRRIHLKMEEDKTIFTMKELIRKEKQNFNNL